ncbi:site-specific integrase [Brevibacillus parabrevis]|uniref:site-specific integrase n=1 Tax=Brevibacillus parabrevis TaxID=54914 RepID=UPI0028535953|nr:site-specific integrase [Brevibacillus parabrevis]MDR5000426.1 site-specific integrase [Brevibacillus parabrevis]
MKMKVNKDEKNGTYWFVVSAGKDEDGKRRQIKRRGFRTEKEAQKEMRKLLQQVDDNAYIKNTKLKYCDFLENEWLTSKALKVRDSTISNYRHIVKYHVSKYFHNHEIGKITTQMVEKFYGYLANEKRLSERTIQDVHKLLKNSFKMAVKRRYISHNPVEDAEAPKVPRKEMQVWNLEETVRFLKVAESSDLYIAFVLAITTGMRQSEALAVRWKDISLKEKSLHVRQTLSHDGKHLRQETKTKSSYRTITLTDKAVEELTKHRKRIYEEKLRAGSAYQDNDLVICTKLGTPIIPRNLLRVFYSLMKKANVPRIPYHGLRHTMASLMLANGTNPKIVKEILGHSGVKVTLDIYPHVLPTVHKETAKQYGDMLFG